jgi:choline dehydrogenase
MPAELTADVAIIGAGSAGCAAAARIIEMSRLHVVLVEAGPDYGHYGDGAWPPELIDARIRPRSHDWGFAERQVDRPLPEPRAKVVGGCSAHNQCAANWGYRDDYDAWAEATGDRSWTYARLRRLIDEIEDANSGDDEVRGHGGRLTTTAHRQETLAAWQKSFLEASHQAGFGRLSDLSSSPEEDGAGVFQANIRNGARWNSAFAFLDPIRADPRLTIVPNAVADHLTFVANRATKLICRCGTDRFEISARVFLLTGGTYGSPCILMRSGIGSATELRSLDIPVVGDVPGVGRNLHDHPGMGVRCRPSSEALLSLAEDLDARRFHQSQVALRACNGQIHVLPYQASLEDGGWSFDLLAFMMRPSSRGRVLLSAPDPLAPPDIRFNLVSDRAGADLAALQAGLRLIEKLLSTPALQELLTSTQPADLLTSTDDAEIDDHIRRNAIRYAHAVGTCRMGGQTDAAAVCDGSGNVRGTENVFVADASLIPTIPRNNTNATCMLIGWRIAESAIPKGG